MYGSGDSLSRGSIIYSVILCMLLYDSHTYRVGMLEFIEAARAYLSTTCQNYRLWVHSSAVSATTRDIEDDKGLSDNVKRKEVLVTGLLQELMLSVQRVIVRHKTNVVKTDQNEGQ